MEVSAKAITELLRQEHFDQVSSQFNDRMKAAMPTNRLARRGCTLPRTSGNSRHQIGAEGS